MRRSLMLVPVMAVLLLAPTGVQAAADDLVACDAPDEGVTVIGPNHSSAPAFATPGSFFPTREYTDLNFQLDLYPAKASNKATLTSTLSWTQDLNDWDLFLHDADGSEIASSELYQFGPLESPAGEYLSMSLLHCSLFTIRVLNYQAVDLGDLDPLQLTVTTGSVK